MFFCFGFNAGLHGVIFVGGVRVRRSGHAGHTERDRGATWGYKKKQEVSVSEEADLLPYVLLMTHCPTGLGGIHP